MEQHDVVRLVRYVDQKDVLVHAGTQGTIVRVYRDTGQVVGYLIELQSHAPPS